MIAAAVAAAGLVAVAATGCAFQRQQALDLAAGADGPHFDDDAFISFDGARLGLTVWEPDPEVFPEPWAVVIAVHGMSEYADAWHMAGPWWASRGIQVYAYDQRGFGRSPSRGVWAGEALLASDVRAAAAAARAAHPGATIAVVGQSMGAASVLYATTLSPDPIADRVIVSAPAVRGWSALPWTYRTSLWVAAHAAPGYAARPPRGIGVRASDNDEALIRNARDPLFLRETRFDTLYGLVSLMEKASKAQPEGDAPLLLLYGENDQLIPRRAVEAFAPNLGSCARSALYKDGWHMLFRDLQAETVWRDVEAFLRDAAAPLPSSAPPVVNGLDGGTACSAPDS